MLTPANAAIEVRLAKGSTWLFDVRGDRIGSARDLAPIPEPES